MWPGGPSIHEVYPGQYPTDYNEQSASSPAVWSVEDGVIIGRQNPPGSGWGGYLNSDKKYGDFELMFEANPDWPADTGILIRKRANSFHGIQILLDHRQSGSIGGFFGNGIGSFHAVPFALDVARDRQGNPEALRQDDQATSIEPFHQGKRELLTRCTDIESFLKVWKFLDWNEFKVRCVGEKPLVTVWINGLEVAQINMATLIAPNYDAEAAADFLGPEGHIAFEVHDNDPLLKEGRWAPDAMCRWRNVRIKEL